MASFFVSRVDTEVDSAGCRPSVSDRRGLAGSGSSGRSGPTGLQGCSRPASRDRDGRPWRPPAPTANALSWASTSTKNKAYPDLLYVDSLIGPDTVNTMPDATIDAFLDHGTVARTIDSDAAGARAHLDRLGGAGIDLADVSRVLEEEGVSSFLKSWDELLQALTDKANAIWPVPAPGDRHSAGATLCPPTPGRRAGDDPGGPAGRPGGGRGLQAT